VWARSSAPCLLRDGWRGAVVWTSAGYSRIRERRTFSLVNEMKPFKPIVSVVIGSLNRREFIEPTIESIRVELEMHEREIIVVDGGSDDGTVEWLLSQKDVITIVQHNRGVWNDEPLKRKSWGYFMNLGFRAASAPAVCMLSDDCLVIPGAIRNGLRVLDQDARTGAVAFYWRNWPEQKNYWVGRTFGDRMFVNHGLYRADALRAAAYADADSYAFYHADGVLAERIIEAGWDCVDSADSFVEHHSHANVAQRAENLQIAADDWSAYVDRWGYLGEPSQDWVVRSYRDPNGTAENYWGRRQAGARARDFGHQVLAAIRSPANLGRTKDQ
jgi:glycosyltransferase involved in cell wall biosynthesis